MNRFIPYSSPGAYGMVTSLWRADRYGNLGEQIDPGLVENGEVTFNQAASPKRSMWLNVTDPHAFRPLRDWVVPILAISDPEGNHVSGPLGLFLVTPPNTNTEPSGTVGKIEGRDPTQLLLMATRDDLVCPAGMDRGAYARQLAYEAGFAHDQVLIPNTGVIQPEDRPWDPGTFVYTAMTDMLTSSNHYAPWADMRGRLLSAPYRPRTEVAPTWIYTNANDQDAADIEGAIVEQPDWMQLANVVTVRKMGYGDTPTISWTERNTNAESPVSIPSLGFEMANGSPVDDPELEDLAAVKAKAQFLLSERASHLRKLTIPTFPDLRADAHQTVGLEITRGSRSIYSSTWWRTGFTFRLDGAATTMTQSLDRVELWR